MEKLPFHVVIVHVMDGRRTMSEAHFIDLCSLAWEIENHVGNELILNALERMAQRTGHLNNPLCNTAYQVAKRHLEQKIADEQVGRSGP